MENSIVVYGTNGHGKCIMDSIQEWDNLIQIQEANTVDELKKLYAEGYDTIIVDFSEDVKKRKEMILEAEQIGFTPATVMDASAQVSQSAKIGKGVYIGKAVVVHPDAEIEDYVILDTKTIVDPEAKIGAFTRIVTAGVIGEGAQIGQCCYIDVRTVVGPHAVIPDETNTEPVSVVK